MIHRLLCKLGFHSWVYADPPGHQRFPYAAYLRCKWCRTGGAR